jgi:hypothetical protein
VRVVPFLLLAGLTAVVSAAPATPRVLVEERPDPEENAPAERDAQPPTESFVARGPVLAGPERQATPSEGDRASGAAPTADEAPALRVRRLPAPPAYRPPVPDPGAEPRAGLRDLPPPRA